MKKLIACLFVVLPLLTACGPLVTQSVRIGDDPDMETASKSVSRKKEVSDRQLMRLHNLLSRMEERVSDLTGKIKSLEPVHTIEY